MRFLCLAICALAVPLHADYQSQMTLANAAMGRGDLERAAKAHGA